MMWAFFMHDQRFQLPAQYKCKEMMENEKKLQICYVSLVNYRHEPLTYLATKPKLNVQSYKFQRDMKDLVLGDRLHLHPNCYVKRDDCKDQSWQICGIKSSISSYHIFLVTKCCHLNKNTLEYFLRTWNAASEEFVTGVTIPFQWGTHGIILNEI